MLIYYAHRYRTAVTCLAPLAVVAWVALNWTFWKGAKDALEWLGVHEMPAAVTMGLSGYLCLVAGLVAGVFGVIRLWTNEP